MILIVNADDFGMSSGVNRGIIQGHQAGVITSASMMVRADAAAEAAALARENPALGVGLHLDLEEWICRDGEWELLYSVVPAKDPNAVRAEVERQLDAFQTLMGRAPDHLDSHQHVHREMPCRRILGEAGLKLGIPVRHLHPGISYCGKFYGQDEKGRAFPQGITVESLLNILRAMPSGAIELACHPAANADMDSVYKQERIQELQSLCDPRVQSALMESGAELKSFQGFGFGYAGKPLRSGS